jgi:hypothetical protein
MSPAADDMLTWLMPALGVLTLGFLFLIGLLFRERSIQKYDAKNLVREGVFMRTHRFPLAPVWPHGAHRNGEVCQTTIIFNEGKNFIAMGPVKFPRKPCRPGTMIKIIRCRKHEHYEVKIVPE